MFPVGDRALGMCSTQKDVGRILRDSRITRYPWEPLNAQQLPGYTSGWWGGKGGKVCNSTPDFAIYETPKISVSVMPDHTAAHLNDDTRRLRKVPERQAKQTHEGRLSLVGLRAAGTEDAAA